MSDEPEKMPPWKVGPLRVPEKDLGQRIRDEIGPVMLAITEGMGPLHDSADDVRAQMRKRGYSEEAAESAAFSFLQHGMAHLWGAMGAVRRG